MKKLLITTLTLTAALLLSACGNHAGSGNDAQQPPDIGGEISGEITVSCYDTMSYQSFLTEAARLFEEKYPGTQINVETFSAMPEIKTAEQGNMKMSRVELKDDPQSQHDYISKINTALMSGTGADILAVDVLPLYKFADSGQLLDLNALMEADPDFDRSAYRANILEASTYKGGLWYVPLEYSFDYFTYDSTLIGAKAAEFGTDSAFTTKDLVETATPSFSGPAKMFNLSGYVKGMGGGMFARALREYYSSFVDIENREAHFTDGGFAELLDSLKEYEQLGYIPAGLAPGDEPGSLMMKSGQEPTERFYFKSKNHVMLQQHFNRDSGRRMMMMMAGSSIGIEDDDELAGIQADAQGQVPFSFVHGCAINIASKNTTLAWAFLKFLLSEEMQLSPALNPMYLPLHNSARAQKAEMELSGAFMGQGQPLDESQQEVLRQYREAVEQFSDQINTYAIRDTVIDEMINAEVQYFLDGVKTAEEVAATLQSKVELYLNE